VPPPDPGLLSIGALSAATGIPVETIRTWERRYGFPRADRKPSGHRVYPLGTIPRLRRIAQAITAGHRAAEVVPASERSLEDLLAAAVGMAPGTAAPLGPGSPARDPADLLAALRAFDAEPLKRSFQQDWARLGPLRFLQEQAAPFLTAVGDGWERGVLEVRHEHFGSAVLGDFLRSVRLPLDERATGPMAALATLPGELHGMGLQMCALVFGLAGWRTLILGVDTPVAQIAALAREAPLRAVALSCVIPRGRARTNPLRTLRDMLPARVALLVGGAAAPPPHRYRGVHIMSDLAALDRWLQTRPAP
jgi:DNA-binding transcriptional MerR regulator